MTTDSPHPACRRIWLFTTIALLLPALFFALLEGGLRLFDYGENLDLFIPAPSGYSDIDFLMVNPNVAKRYFSNGAYSPQPPYYFLAMKKPPIAYRFG